MYGFVIPKLALGFGVWLLLYRANDAREPGRKDVSLPAPASGRMPNAAGVVPAFRLAMRWCGVVVAGLLVAATDAGNGNAAARAGVGTGYAVPNALETPGSAGA